MLWVAVLALSFIEGVRPLRKLLEVLDSEGSFRVDVNCRRLNNLLDPCHTVANL